MGLWTPGSRSTVAIDPAWPPGPGPPAAAEGSPRVQLPSLWPEKPPLHRAFQVERCQPHPLTLSPRSRRHAGFPRRCPPAIKQRLRPQPLPSGPAHDLTRGPAGEVFPRSCPTCRQLVHLSCPLGSSVIEASVISKHPPRLARPSRYLHTQ